MTHPAIVSPPPGQDGTRDIVNRSVTDEPVKCDQCGRTIAWKATRPWCIRCRSCKIDVERL